MQSYDILIAKRRALVLEFSVSKREDIICEIKSIDKKLKEIESKVLRSTAHSNNY